MGACIMRFKQSPCIVRAALVQANAFAEDVESIKHSCSMQPAMYMKEEFRFSVLVRVLPLLASTHLASVRSQNAKVEYAKVPRTNIPSTKQVGISHHLHKTETEKHGMVGETV